MPDKQTINTRYMPTLSNGNIGVTVYDNKMYLNGLYSGTGGVYNVFSLIVLHWINHVLIFIIDWK